jgi:hypothetical protein
MMMVTKVIMRNPKYDYHNASSRQRRTEIIKFRSMLMDEWCAGGANRDQLVWDLLLEGEALMETAATTTQQTYDVNSNQQRNLKRCSEIAKEGDFQKAIQNLSSRGIAVSTEETTKQLLDKHPQNIPLPNIGINNDIQQIRISKDDVMAAIKSFKKNAAPGRSGLRASHLINCVAGNSDFISNLTKIIQSMIDGKVPIVLAPLIAGGPLIPLLKKDGGIRPITIGEILKRITSKIALRKTVKKFQALTEGIQLGVGIKNGIEAVIHCLNNAIRSEFINDDDLAILVDFSNAFNLIDRQPIIDTVQAHLPEISKWVQFLYCSASYLFLPGGKIILCCTGVQQGDPLSMALFCMAAHPLLFKLSQIVSSTNPSKQLIVAAICDDWSIIVPDAETAIKCLQLIDSEGPALGLIRSRTKSVIWSPKKHSISEHCDALQRLFHGTITVSRESGVELLGGALSADNTFLGKVALKRVNKAIDVIHLVMQIDDPQVCIMLLRQCLGTNKMTYCFRTMPPEALDEAVAIFREVLHDALRKIIVNNAQRLSSFHLKLAALPASMSGLGINMPDDIIISAALASHLETLTMQYQLCTDLTSCERLSNKTAQMQRKYTTYIHQLVRPDDWSTFFLQISSLSRIQYTLTNLVHRSRREHLMADPFLFNQSDPVVARIHELILASTAFKPTRRQTQSVLPVRRMVDSVANHWLFAIPCEKYQQTMSPRDFRSALALRMLLPILPVSKQCNNCSSVMDIYGYHALSCGGHSNSRTKRHDNLRDAVFEFLRLTNFNPTKNAKVQCLGTTSSGSHLFRPADCLFDGDEHALTCLDITVVTALTPARCNKQLGAIVLEAAKEKWEKHLRPCQQAHFDFMPFAVDVCGLVDWTAATLIKRIACKYAEITLKSYAECMNIVRRRISFAIQVGVARQLSRAALL